MANLIELNSVSFSYYTEDFSKSIDTSTYFIPDTTTIGTINVKFTILNYVLAPEDLSMVSVQLFCDGTSLGVDQTNWLWFETEPSRFPPINTPVSVSVYLSDLDRVEKLLTPGEHTITLRINGSARPDYSGSAVPPSDISTNSITVTSLPNISRYNENLARRHCIPRVYANGGWRFCQIKNAN